MEMNKVSVNQPNHNKEFYDDVLLPGFRFHPTDEELVSFYLKRKVEKKPLSIDFIKNIDIYKYNPWDLPSMCNRLGKNQEEWYFFCKRGRKYRNSARPNRVITGSGFWKATGIDRPVYSSTAGAGGSDDVRHGCVGLKKSLVFYRGAAGKGTKTDWMMHEFRLPITNSYTTGAQKRNDSFQDEAEVWTLCRILKRDISQRKDVSASQHQKNSKLIEKPIFNMNSCSTNTTDYSSENPTSLHNEGSYKNFFSETSSNLQVPMVRETWDELTSLIGYHQPSTFMYSSHE